MRVLVLGGSRFMGRHVAEQVIQAGGRVTVLNRGNNPAVPGVEALAGDRSAPAGLDALAGREFDAVVDLSAYQSSWVGTATEALAGRIGQYVFISSGSVYAPSSTLPWPETNPIGPSPAWGSYAVEKVAAEQHLRELGERGTLSSTILRLPYVLGAGNYADREAFVFSRLAAGRPILLPGGGRAINQYVHAADVARAVLACLELAGTAAWRVFNVGLPTATTSRGFVELCAELTGQPAQLITVPGTSDGVLPELVDLADVIYPIPEANYFLDTRAIAEQLDFATSIPLAAILNEFYRWWLAQDERAPRNYPRERQALLALGRTG